MLKRFLKRFAADATDERSASIKAWVATLPGVTPIAEAEPRSMVKLAGVVQAMRVRPREGVSVVEAEIDDGSGTFTAVWLGRRAIAGLHLGSRLIVEGRLGGSRTQLQVMNPSYELAPSEP